MLGTALAFGSIGFWVVTVIALFALAIFVEFDWWPWSLAVIVATTCAISFLGNNEDRLAALTANPLAIVYTLIFYTFCGIAWSFFRWYDFVKKRVAHAVITLARIRLEAATVLKKRPTYNGKPYAEPTEEEISQQMDTHYFGNLKKPLAADYKGKVVSWIMFWPISMINYLIFDFIRNCVNYLYKRLIRFYQFISDHLYKDIDPRLSK